MNFQMYQITYNDFINVTLVCDDDRFNAHKVFKPFKKENWILLLTFFTIKLSCGSSGCISYLAVDIVEAFLMKKGVSAFRNLNIQIYVLHLESKCPKFTLPLKHNATFRLNTK